IPGALACFAVGCVIAGGLWPVWLRTVIFYWASWHFVAQAYGILRIYQRKQNAIGTIAARLEKAILFLSCFFCVAHRIYTGPWELFGVQIWHPYPKAWMVNGIGAVTVVAVLGYVAVALQRRPRSAAARDAGRVALVRPLLVASTAFGFYMPFVVIKEGTSAFAAAALWHAVQYIGIVWHYNRTRYAGKHDPDARLISWASQPGHTLGYVAMLAGCAAGVYGVALLLLPLVPWTLSDFSLALWTGLTLGHYYLDGKIWKFKQYDLNNLV